MNSGQLIVDSGKPKVDLEQVKREAAVCLIGRLARAMSATVVYYNPEFGEFALKMDPRALEFFDVESVRMALESVA